MKGYPNLNPFPIQDRRAKQQAKAMFPVNSVFRLALLGLRRSGLVVPHPGPAAQGVHALGGRCGTSVFRTLRA